MRNKRDIYCDFSFWEAFFDLEERVLHDRTKRRLWDSFYEFLADNNVFFNISKQEVNEDSKGGKNLYEISRKKGGAGIRFINDTFPKINALLKIDDNILNSVFLTMLETSECDALSRKYGVIVFNLPMIFSAKHVFIDNGIAFYKANGQNWSYLMGLNERQPSLNCCNSIVIIDRYLLYDQNEKAIETNLKPLLEAFLPQDLEKDISFTICIIAENNVEKCSPIEDKLIKINTLIKTIRPNLNFKLNIFHTWLHDRSILTNNVILTSGAGFDVIGLDDIPLKFTTTSLCFPFLQNKGDNSIYLDWINNVLKKERKCRIFKENYWGDQTTKHHLLDYYDEKPKSQNKKLAFDNAYPFPTDIISIASPLCQTSIGIFHKGENGSKGVIIEKDRGFKQQVRSIREGELLCDGDEVEYELRYEKNLKNPSKKFWFACDVHSNKQNGPICKNE